ncbi:hypothetical protein ABS768_03315 [Flavobacterium sp. ST-75]|uniref:Uncharacterized protein n=1 Tax=Flavobacterium rhizophilum TaxID=3163296 RepID=A0ABW8YB14_9FLAO
MYISKFGLKCIVFFLFFSFLGRILFPFGDEPDFSVRAPQLIFGEYNFLVPYNYLQGILQELNYNTYCVPVAGVNSLWAVIPENYCIESFEQILLRFIIIIVVSLPLLVIIVFRSNKQNRFFLIRKNIEIEVRDKRLDSIALSLIFTGTIYYIGLLSVEQFIICLGFFVFLFKNNIFALIVILLLSISLDLGNSSIIVFFIGLEWFFKKIYKQNNLRKLLFIILLLLSVALILGSTSLLYIQNLPFLQDKANAMYEIELDRNFREKYPILLRPFITCITAFFMTPSGVKVLVVQLLYFIGFSIVLLKVKKVLIKDSFPSFLASLTTILFFVFLFPNYANVKYYIFLIPTILLFVSEIFDKNKLANFFIGMNLILFFHLLLYRL